jgi:predicted kinase
MQRPLNLPPPIVFLLCGPSLAGKSRLAALLARSFAASIICADDINARRGLPFGGEGLPESVWAETLQLQLEQLRVCAADGRHAIVDDTLCYRWLRDRFRQQAADCGMQQRLLLLRPDADELLRRHQRLSQSRERPVLRADRLADHLARFEWPAPDEGAVDLTEPAALQAWLAADRAALEHRP